MIARIVLTDIDCAESQLNSQSCEGSPMELFDMTTYRSRKRGSGSSGERLQVGIVTKTSPTEIVVGLSCWAMCVSSDENYSEFLSAFVRAAGSVTLTISSRKRTGNPMTYPR